MIDWSVATRDVQPDIIIISAACWKLPVAAGIAK